MTQIRLSKYLKIIILGAAVTGLIIYLWAIPEIGQSIAEQYPEFSHCYYPWLILLWTTAIPCYCALLCCFKIAASLKSDKAFTAANGRLFKIIAVLALTDTSFYTGKFNFPVFKYESSGNFFVFSTDYVCRYSNIRDMLGTVTACKRSSRFAGAKRLDNLRVNI